MASTTNKVRLSEDQLADFRRKNRIRAFALIRCRNGSYGGLNSEWFGLAEFEEGHVPGYLGLGRIERDLSTLLGDATVEINTPAPFTASERQKLSSEAVIRYGCF